KSAFGKLSPLWGHFAVGADLIVRAGTNGMFYLSGIAFNRGPNGVGALFLARLIDDNNVAGKNPISYLDTRVLDTGIAGRFIDKPWMVVDIPRTGAKTCTISSPGAKVAQTFAAGNVYVGYMIFTGNG